MQRKYKSEMSATIHEITQDFFESGLMDAETMRDLDKSCLFSGESLAPTGKIHVADSRDNGHC